MSTQPIRGKSVISIDKVASNIMVVAMVGATVLGGAANLPLVPVQRPNTKIVEEGKLAIYKVTQGSPGYHVVDRMGGQMTYAERADYVPRPTLDYTLVAMDITGGEALRVLNGFSPTIPIYTAVSVPADPTHGLLTKVDDKGPRRKLVGSVPLDTESAVLVVPVDSAVPGKGVPGRASLADILGGK